MCARFNYVGVTKHVGEKTEAKEWHLLDCGRGRQNVLSWKIFSLTHLLEWMLSKPFQPSRWSEECHQFRRSNPITLLEKSLKPQCQWSLRMKDRNGERQTREQETECQNCLPLDDLYSLNYKTRPAAKVNSCRQDNEHVNFHLCSGVYAYHSLSFLDSLPSFSLI